MISSLASAQEGASAGTPWADVSLYRDEWGTPHVYAENPEAMAFGFGYAQAEDHLESMLLAYRSASGRVAEIMGRDFAQADAFAIKMGSRNLAFRAYEEATPLTRSLCTGFAQGVNAWMVDHPEEVPLWAEGVEAGDILTLWHAFIVAMAPLDAPGVFAPPRPMESGNAWVMAPFRTKEEAAVLVLNPHQFRDGPFRWYEAHLVTGDYDVAGATLYGLPIILQGHNGALGWALTPNEVDFADVYEEQPPKMPHNPKDPRILAWREEQSLSLEYMAQAQPYYVWTPEGMRQEYTPAMMTSRGPVLEDENGGLFTWRVGGFFDFGILDQCFEMGRSQNLEAFLESLWMGQMPCFHILYADKEGHIAYRYNAKTGTREMHEHAAIPKKDPGPGIDWTVPLPAHFDGDAWRFLIPPDALPTLIDPPTGYLQACGNPPWTVTDEAPFQADSWPYWFGNDIDTFRARRMRQLLRNGLRSFRDNHSMLYDTLLPVAVDLVPLLIKAAEKNAAFVEQAHPDLRNGLSLLRQWNFIAEPNQKGMSFYHFWWIMLRQRSLSDFPNDAARYAFLYENSPQAEQLMLDAAADAARFMRNEYQSLEVAWGEIHRLQRGGADEAALGAYVGEPILLSAGDRFEGGRLPSDYGYAFAMLVQFEDRPRALSIAPFGASENPASPHSRDQMPLFLDKRMKQAWYAQDQVWRYARSVFGARVGLYPKGVEGLISFSAQAPMEARVSTTVDAPTALPQGLAAFSIFMQPQVAPLHDDFQMLFDLYIPKALCAAEDLLDLAICGWREEKGWFSLAGQQLDRERRVLTASSTESGVFVVLGPEHCFIAPQAPEEKSSEEGEEQSKTPVGPLSESGESVAAVPATVEAPPSRGVFKFTLHKPPQKPSPGPAPENSADASNAPIPLAPGQKFSLERHDRAPEETDQPPATKGRVMMTDDLSKVQEAFKESATAAEASTAPAEASSPEPPAPNSAGPDSLKSGQKFKLERLDSSGLAASKAKKKTGGGRVFMVDDFSKLPEGVRPNGIVRRGPPPAPTTPLPGE